MWDGPQEPCLGAAKAENRSKDENILHTLVDVYLLSLLLPGLS